MAASRCYRVANLCALGGARAFGWQQIISCLKRPAGRLPNIYSGQTAMPWVYWYRTDISGIYSHPRLEYILVEVDFLASSSQLWWWYWRFIVDGGGAPVERWGEGALLIVEMVAGVSAGFSYDDYDADPVQ